MARKTMVIGFFFLGFLMFCSGVHGRKVALSKEEDIEIENKLRILNKSPIKTLQIDGVTFDCIDIYKQPALDHPLLINHTIQLRPSSSLETNPGSTSFTTLFGNKLGRDECPTGTVIIRRVTKEDLINSKSFSTFSWSIKPIIPTPHVPPTRPPPATAKQHWAFILTDIGNIYGAKGSPDVFGLPKLMDTQLSAVYIVVGSGENDKFNAIHAGWSVNPSLYGDNHTHFSIVWTADGYHKTGCPDMVCQGFVQVDKSVTPGLILHPLSTYNWKRYTLPIIISKDQQSGNWWLKLGPQKLPIGYWPGSLFAGLTDHADLVYWGGLAHAPLNIPGPPMGSGHFPTEGWTKACSFTGVQYMDAKNNFQYPERVGGYVDDPTCYAVGDTFDRKEHDGLAFFFGGPAGCP